MTIKFTHPKKFRLRLLNPLELLTIASIIALKEEAYPSSIKKQIQIHTGEKIPDTSIYLAVNKLRDNDYLSWKIVDKEQNGHNRPKRIYTVTEKGKRLYRRSKGAMLKMFSLEELS